MCVHACMCVWVGGGVHNLTRDYMNLTELMSKSTGSALGLPGGGPERWREGERKRGRDRTGLRKGEEERDGDKKKNGW